MAAAQHRRRARKLKAFVEDVDLAVVFTRDKGICGICSLPVDPDNWHLDHVVPLARGGEHSYENTQVSHPSCNQQKGARPQIPTLQNTTSEEK
jgi:5-methylcytosine-specific restriction endonuclease McrA